MATQVEGGTTGTKLSAWLKSNKLQDILEALTAAGLEYDDIMQASEDDLKEIFTEENIPRKYLLRLKSALKKIPTSVLAQQSVNAAKSPQSVVVLSSSQNDFILNIHSNKEKTLKNVAKVQEAMETLTTSSNDIKKKVDNQYISLMKLLEKRKEFIINNIDNVVTKKTKSLNEQLTSVTNAKNTMEQIENDINQCLSSNQSQITQTQAKINKIINSATIQIQSIQEFMDENMAINTKPMFGYECNEKLFEDFITSNLDHIVADYIEFSSQPIFDKNKQLITFKVKYGKNMKKEKYRVEGQYICDDQDDEKKQNDENKGDWIMFGEFDLSYNKNKNIQEIKITTNNQKINKGMYRLRLSNDKNVVCLANTAIFIERVMCWNEEDKDNYITLTNNELTVTHRQHSGINHLIRANRGYSEGVHSFQIKVDKYDGGGNGNNCFGVATKEAPRELDWQCKKGAKFWGFYAYNLAMPHQLGERCKSFGSNQVKSGSTVTFVLDTNNRKLTCYLESKKASEITSMSWNGQDTLYPALYVGAFNPNTYTAVFNESQINIPQ